LSDNQNIFERYFSAMEHTSDYKDRLMMEIICRKEEFEQNLDSMRAIYGKGIIRQLAEYQKGVDNIKKAGLKVLRNSAGKHKITF